MFLQKIMPFIKFYHGDMTLFICTNVFKFDKSFFLPFPEINVKN